MRSFLSDRRAKVQVGGSHSRSFRIRRGVPQGSVLGPVLFILFVDDITKDLPRGAHASLYADDLAIWSSSQDPLKASSVVQSSLTVLETWSSLWRLPLNPKKCESSFFSTWFPFLCNTATNHLEVLHRAACRVITRCLSSTPSSLLLLEAQLPPLKLTLEHQTLYSFERALRLPFDFSSLYALAIKNVPRRLKKKPSWRSSCSSATQPLPSPRESLITCPPFPPWSTTHFTVSPFIPDCTGSSTARLQIASSRLSSLPPSDIQVWTDGSVPSLFGPGGAGVYATCSKCNTSHSLSFSSGPIASSFTAETFALKQGLAWCTSHLMTCKFQSVLFLTDSQSALSILFSAPTYLLPESLWNVWSLASSLSNYTTLSFQWVPGHAGLPGNEKADLLAKTGASLPTDAIPSPLLPVIAKVRYSQHRNWRRHISHSHLNFQVPEVSSKKLLLSRPICSELSRFRCHGHSLLLSSFLHRISRKENSACSACGHPLQDLNHLLLDCPASEPLRKSIFGSTLSIRDLWSRPWGVARLLGLRGVPPRHHPSEGVG